MAWNNKSRSRAASIPRSRSSTCATAASCLMCCASSSPLPRPWLRLLLNLTPKLRVSAPAAGSHRPRALRARSRGSVHGAFLQPLRDEGSSQVQGNLQHAQDNGGLAGLGLLRENWLRHDDFLPHWGKLRQEQSEQGRASIPREWI